MQFRTLTLSTATALWCLIAIVPFASPIHYVPMPQWWSEIITVWLTLGAGLLLVCNGTLFERLPRATILCFILALCWAVQPWMVKTLFPGMTYATALAFIVMGFLAAATLTLREGLGSSRVTFWLAWALVAGALLQSLIGFTQLTGLASSMGGVVFYDYSHPTTDIFGHIGQRNQYAHYLMWGMIAGVYLYSVEKLRGVLFTLWTVWLSIMIAYAASRTVLLYVVAVFIIGIVWHARVRTAASRRMMLGMFFACVLIVAAQFLMPMMNQLVSLVTHSHAAVSSGVERLASNGDDMSSRRFAEMHKAWMVFRAHPFRGVGWSQYAAQSVTLQALPQFANDGVNSGLFTNAHNLILQLLAEMGGVVTAIVVLGLIWTVLPYFTQKAQIEGVLPLACMAVTLIHSMLEYPLWYLYFLAMLVVFCALAPQPPRESAQRLSVGWRLFLLAGMLVVGVLSITSVRHYESLVSMYTPTNNATVDKQSVVKLGAMVAEDPLFASQALYTLDNYIESTPDNLAQKRQWIDLLAAYRPYPDVLMKQAEMQALVGQEAQAEATLRLALASFPTYAHDFIEDMQEGPAAWSTLRKMSSDAYYKLPPNLRNGNE